MKICFDTCVIIDFLGKTDRCYDAFMSLDIALANGFEICCSASSTTDIVYLMHSRGFAKTQLAARKSIEEIIGLFKIISNNEIDVCAAIASDIKDYEDGLIAFSSKRSGVDFIVTSNKKDFISSPVPALTPCEFSKMFKKIDYSYEQIEG